MPSLAQLQAEPWWSREIVTPELSWLGAELCRRTGQPKDAFGSKGNTAHLSGGHRSQEWLKNSDWCENRSYTVQSGLTETQARHIGACDFTPGQWGTSANRKLMAQHTKALFDAARSGRLAGVRQVFGTLDGVHAIGLNVVSNSLTVPDDSHLDHLHLTFDRAHMRDQALMARIADLIGDDMAIVDWTAAWTLQRAVIEDADQIVIPASADLGYGGFSGPNKLKARLVALDAKVDALGAPAPVHLSDGDRIAIAAMVAGELKPLIDALPKPPTAAELEAASDRAVRKALGQLDEAA